MRDGMTISLPWPGAERKLRQSFLRRRFAARPKMSRDRSSRCKRERLMCPCKGMFARQGGEPGLGAACMAWRSLGRNSQIRTYGEREKPCAKDHALAHFAPEQHRSPGMPDRVGGYQTADLRDDAKLTRLRANEDHTNLPADSHARFAGRKMRDRIRAAGVDRHELTADWRDVAPHAIAFRSSVFIATKPAV